MEYDGSKLKVKIDKKEDRCALQILEMPNEWRGVSSGGGGDMFEASNGYKIKSFNFPAINIAFKDIALRGKDPYSDNLFLKFPTSSLDEIIEALREFGANIVGNIVCNDHEWITIYEGDPIYEGTFCKKCRKKQS